MHEDHEDDDNGRMMDMIRKYDQEDDTKNQICSVCTMSGLRVGEDSISQHCYCCC